MRTVKWCEIPEVSADPSYFKEKGFRSETAEASADPSYFKESTSPGAKYLRLPQIQAVSKRNVKRAFRPSISIGYPSISIAKADLGSPLKPPPKKIE